MWSSTHALAILCGIAVVFDEAAAFEPLVRGL
jgi:hypothetical protein